MSTLTLEKPRTNGVKKTGVHFEVDRITPDAARELLANKPASSVRQRPLNKQHVLRLADQMKKGKWFLQYEPILISPSGFVVEGQHRLHAVIESATTQPFLVVRNVDESLIDKINIGRKRNAADVLAMAGYKNWNLLSSTLTNLWRFYEKGSLAKGGGNTIDYPAEYDYLALAHRFPGAVHAVSYAEKHAGGARFMVASSIATLYYILGEISPDDRNVFFSKLMSGAGLVEGEVVHILREKLIALWMERKAMRVKTSAKKSDRMALIIKAWNAYRKGKEVKRLVYGKSESFPQPV